MPTDENQNVGISANSNGGINPDAVNNANVEPIINDEKLDIDLNLDGIDIAEKPIVEESVVQENKEDAESTVEVQEELEFPIEELKDLPVVEEEKTQEAPKVEVNDTEESSAREKKVEEADNDRLLEEDKQVEELQGSKPVEEIKVEEVTEEVKQTEVSDLGDLDIPFVETKEEEAKEEVLEEKIEKVVENNQVERDSPTEEFHTEDLGEIVVENKEGDIVSDTGDMNSDKDGYIPNEHDFNQVTDALNSNEQGPIDLGSLEEKKNDSSDLKEGLDLHKEEPVAGAMDLDSMIANMGAETNNLLDTADASKTIQEAVVAPEPTLEPVSTDVEINNVQGGQIDLGSSEVVANSNIEQANINVENADNVVNQPVDTTVVNQNVVAPGAVILSEDPTKKNKHTGLKVFVLIIVLVVLGVVILSKMYPEEFGDIMSAVKGEDTTVIEYSDNADMGTVLEETQDDITSSEDNKEVVKEIEVVDPDSLAGQLESDNVSGNTMEYVTDGDGTETGHEATEDEFNAFGGIEDVMDPVTAENADLLQALRDYQEEGEEYNVWGREINNTTAMKYGSYISKKAGESIIDIENGIKIDIVKINDYFAQFDIYIAKLDKLRVSVDGEATADVAGQVQDDALISSGTDEPTTASTGTVQ